MARGRMIAQTVATDKRLNALSVEAELIYLKTIPQLDRDGLILGEPTLLWAKVCPRRPELMGRIECIIGEWVTCGLVVAYDGDDGPCLYFVGFAKNQTGMRYDREAASSLPVPPGYTRTDTGLVPAAPKPPADPIQPNSGVTPELLRTNSTLKQSKGSESKATARVRHDVTAQQAARHTHGNYDGCNPATLTRITNHVKRIYGFHVLVDKPGDDTVEDKMRDEAYRLWKIGFSNDDQMGALADAWRNRSASFSDKRPYGDQLYETALTLLSKPATNGGTVNFSLEEINA